MAMTPFPPIPHREPGSMDSLTTRGFLASLLLY
jgi:hypothetical protein